MNGYREENTLICYFHPKQVVIGVCPLCLNERLLILATKQGQLSAAAARSSNRRAQSSSKQHRKPHITLPKIFAFGGSILSRLEFRHWKSEHSDHDASTSREAFEDSFISIKFGDNGVASWEKNPELSSSKVSLDQNCNISRNHTLFTKEAKEMATTTKSVVEHGKQRASLRWRKRIIGHLFQLIRWKRSNKGNVCHVNSKVEGGKVVRKSWIRTLTKRKTTME